MAASSNVERNSSTSPDRSSTARRGKRGSGDEDKKSKLLRISFCGKPAVSTGIINLMLLFGDTQLHLVTKFTDTTDDTEEKNPQKSGSKKSPSNAVHSTLDGATESGGGGADDALFILCNSDDLPPGCFRVKEGGEYWVVQSDPQQQSYTPLPSDVAATAPLHQPTSRSDSPETSTQQQRQHRSDTPNQILQTAEAKADKPTRRDDENVTFQDLYKTSAAKTGNGKSKSSSAVKAGITAEIHHQKDTTAPLETTAAATVSESPLPIPKALPRKATGNTRKEGGNSTPASPPITDTTPNTAVVPQPEEKGPLLKARRRSSSDGTTAAARESLGGSGQQRPKKQRAEKHFANDVAVEKEPTPTSAPLQNGEETSGEEEQVAAAAAVRTKASKAAVPTSPSPSPVQQAPHDPLVGEGASKPSISPPQHQSGGGGGVITPVYLPPPPPPVDSSTVAFSNRTSGAHTSGSLRPSSSYEGYPGDSPALGFSQAHCTLAEEFSLDLSGAVSSTDSEYLGED